MRSSEHRHASERRSLGSFRGSSYTIGRGRPWQACWLLVDSLLFRRWWLPARCRVSILRAFGAEVGEGVLVRHDVRIHWPWKLAVGDHSWIGVGAWILNLEPVTIGSDTCISQAVLLCTGSHDAASPTFEFDNAPITIGSGVWIGARATVLRGVSIADDATIGATTLVVKDVPAGARVVAPVGLVQPSE